MKETDTSASTAQPRHKDSIIRELKQEISEANRKLHATNVIAETVSQSLDLEEVLNSALDRVLELTKGTKGAIFIMDQESQRLYPRAYRGLSQEFIQAITGLKVGEELAGKVVETGKAIFGDDIGSDPRISPSIIRSHINQEGLRAFASFPLRSKSQILGVMSVSSPVAHQFKAEDIELLDCIANQVAVAIENALLHQEIQRRGEMRRHLLQQCIYIQEEERRRIARELHDDTSQVLTSLSARLEAIMCMLPPDLHPNSIHGELRGIQSSMIRMIDDTHRMIYQLRPTVLDDLGLVAAVRWQADNLLEARGIKVRFDSAGKERKLPSDVEIGLFRIIQEATNNIVKHAEAWNSKIEIRFEDNMLSILVEDDGRGFDVDQVMNITNEKRGFGLLNIKERVEYMGGQLSIQSQLNLGSQITVQIPTCWAD